MLLANDGRYIFEERRRIVVSFTASIIRSIRLHINTISIRICIPFSLRAISAAAPFARSAKQQSTPTTFSHQHQAFKRFLCLEHRTRGGIPLTNPAFVSDLFQGITNRIGCPERSPKWNHLIPPKMTCVHVCAYVCTSGCLPFPKWNMHQPSPNNHKSYL